MDQPELAARIALMQIESEKSERIAIPGTRRHVRIRFLHDYTVQKITELLLKREEIESAARSDNPDDVMRSAVKHPYFSIKMAVLAVLNSPLKIALIYPLKWRWWAFVRKYNEAQMASVTMAIQKKNQGVLHDVLSNYRVLDGYEDGRDGTDEGGSRAIPSRTHAGRIAAFVKDFPCYGDVRWVPFVGRIVNYTARCVLTAAQVRLMQSDLPHTLYLRDGNNGGKNGKKSFRYNPEDPAIRLQMEANRRRKERMEMDGEDVEYTMEELFNN